ncbi:hypothetical protein HPP92_012843 [Vanilla planifolia]|uniref:Polygalacturonase n=1 Tax=Vanilla planifolia TaxID=51239 RepID=A0A835QXL3_VANPL|nr:hypothetical protein HPP92_012843 [Vanilla planifolia]
MFGTGSSSGRFLSQQSVRGLLSLVSAHRIVFTVLWSLVFAFLVLSQLRSVERLRNLLWGNNLLGATLPLYRPVAFNLTDFGGVGDGVTVNTEAFKRAVAAISKFKNRGGAQLNLLPGRWLTGPFNLTSHMTVFLDQHAVILGITDEKQWPLMPPLPSYGHGRELKGPRYGSLIQGQNLVDVVITGNNGTIDGQGQPWWTKFRKRSLSYTRGPLVQLMWSKDIKISNITLKNSPFWTVHPYDCKNVTIANVTILTPVFGAPNTDGIDPDSCEDVVIEDCYIRVGDDGIAIKSGWDQYGMKYAKPSTNILIRNVTICSLVSAGVSIGSEMSGGVSNVTVENVRIWSSRRGLRIKTAAGRGGYVRNISYRNVSLDDVRVGIVIKTDYNEHPDDGFDPTAIPNIDNITYDGIHGERVQVPVRLQGSEDVPVKGISFHDMSIGLAYVKKHHFQCSFVEGRVIGSVYPIPCDNLDRYDEHGRLAMRSASQNVSDIDYYM